MGGVICYPTHERKHNIMNKQIRLMKKIFIIGYPIVAFLLWQRYATPQIFSDISFDNFLNVGMHFIVLVLAIIIWGAMTYFFTTYYFTKKMIQRKVDKAEKVLGKMATVTLISYRPNIKENYVTMKWRSCGISPITWNEKCHDIQACINYTIFGDIENDGKDLTVVTFKARKGKIKPRKEVLYDEDF